MKKAALFLLAALALFVVLFWANPQIAPSHNEPYLALNSEKSAAAPAETAVVQRVILYGDAGHSSLEPWQASMALAARRAAISPEKTVVVALGDNIYMRGYPQLDEGQTEWDEDQMESISFLDAQLKIAGESGAKMYFVPGNHDWYATELDSQARHIADYARRENRETFFEPYEKGQPPMPESVDLPGVSLVFVDSEWLLQNPGEPRARALAIMDRELARIRREHPANLVIVNQHHPLLTEGPHGSYFSDFSYWAFMHILYAITEEAAREDTFHPNYQDLIRDQNRVMAAYPGVIHAAGHEHSLQLFRPEFDSADYLLVSGAGNDNKISGVWHNDDTRFAVSKEGFMELLVTPGGVYLQVFTSDSDKPVSGFWLDLSLPAAALPAGKSLARH